MKRSLMMVAVAALAAAGLVGLAEAGFYNRWIDSPANGTNLVTGDDVFVQASTNDPSLDTVDIQFWNYSDPFQNVDVVRADTGYMPLELDADGLKTASAYLNVPDHWSPNAPTNPNPSYCRAYFRDNDLPGNNYTVSIDVTIYGVGGLP